MSHSRRKIPIFGNTNCSSERQDKKIWHRRWRTSERTVLANADPEGHLPVLERQVSSIWSMGKDGRTFWSVERRVTTADRVAAKKGKNSQEQESLKKRLLKKWMAK